eukprot:gene3126-3685_t
MWNLALSPGERGAFGGCGTCRGLLTVDGDRHYAEPEYYVLAHLSRAARRGSTVLDVTSPLDVVSVGFRRPDGSVGVYGYNGSDRDRYLRLEVSGTEGQVFRIGPRELAVGGVGRDGPPRGGIDEDHGDPCTRQDDVTVADLGLDGHRALPDPHDARPHVVRLGAEHDGDPVVDVGLGDHHGGVLHPLDATQEV